MGIVSEILSGSVWVSKGGRKFWAACFLQDSEWACVWVPTEQVAGGSYGQCFSNSGRVCVGVENSKGNYGQAVQNVSAACVHDRFLFQ